MLDNPKISVIMSVYNGENYLGEAIESILNQTFTDFEFIIVNDGSTDNSLEIIKSYDDERIKIINNEQNIGLTKSLNNALKVAKGEYIARQDADDISLANRFEEQIKYFGNYPETALLATSIYKIDEYGNIIGKEVALAKPTLKDLFKTNQFRHGSVMFKEEVVVDLGDYNELFKYIQDYELWLRIAKRHKVRNLTQPLYKLRLHDKKVGFTNVKESALYHLLALKLAKNDIDEDALEIVKNNGIKSLHLYLNKSEMIYLHKAMAGMYVRSNDLKLAREEYKKIFVSNPFDIINCINVVRSYFGRSMMAKTTKIYSSFMNFFENIIQHLKNYRSI